MPHQPQPPSGHGLRHGDLGREDADQQLADLLQTLAA